MEENLSSSHALILVGSRARGKLARGHYDALSHRINLPGALQRIP